MEEPVSQEHKRPREVEAKFVLLDNALASLWRESKDLVSGFALDEGVVVEECDTYFDTADFALLRRGHTLRLRDRERSGAHEQIAGYKDIDFRTPRGVHSRIEVEQRLESPLAVDAALTLAELPESLAIPLQELLLHQSKKEHGQVRPIAQIDQRRHKSAVTKVRSGRNSGGRRTGGATGPFAELSIDELRYKRPDPASDGGDAVGGTVVWTEVGGAVIAEVELIESGRRSDLRMLATRMGELPGVEATDLGKLQGVLLALAERRTRESMGAIGDAHTAEFCRAIWGSQLTEMLLNEAGVRESDDIEYVHQMRVATRRARAAMRLYAGYFSPRSRSVKRFGRALRTTGRALGRVRDLDVALTRLRRFADEQVESHPGGGKKGRKDLRANMRRLTERRARAHADLVAWLDSRKYARFVARFADFCNKPGKGVLSVVPVAGEAPPPVQLRHTLPSMIWSRFEAVRAFEPLFEAAGTAEGSLPVETLHALRIECKYLRYHLEFASALLGEEGKKLIAAIKVLQEELGALNDAVVGGQILREGDQAERAQEVTPDAGADAEGVQRDGDAMAAWHAEQSVTIERMRGAIPSGFANFVGIENRKRLALALARL